MQPAEHHGVGQPGGCPADQPDGRARRFGGGVGSHDERSINYSLDRWRERINHRCRSIALHMDLPGCLFRVLAIAVLCQNADHLLDHGGVAAQEHVGVIPGGLEAPGLGHHPLFPQVLHPAGVAGPGHGLLIRPVDGGQVGEVWAQVLQGQQLRAVGQVPRVIGPVQHGKAARCPAGELAGHDAHVGRQPGAGGDHHHILARGHLVEGEHAGGLGAQEQRVAEAQRKQARGQRAV